MRCVVRIVVLLWALGVLLLCGALTVGAESNSYRVVVSVDGGKSWRPVPLPGKIVQTILDELALEHVPPGTEARLAIIQINHKTTTWKKPTERNYVIHCSEPAGSPLGGPVWNEPGTPAVAPER